MTFDDLEHQNKDFYGFFGNSEIGGALWWVQVKHYTYLAAGLLALSGDWFCFTGLSLKL